MRRVLPPYPQVDLGGTSHGLTPLEVAAPHMVHVFDEPTLWHGALWLPYRWAWELAVRWAWEPAVRVTG
jgi:hypothetical protein